MRASATRRVLAALLAMAAAVALVLVVVVATWPLPAPARSVHASHRVYVGQAGRLLGSAQARPRSARAGGGQTRQHGSPCRPQAPCLAIVIDDVGRDVAALDRLLGLQLDISYAVLPHAALRKESLARLRSAGREVLLHLPLEPHDAREISDEALVLRRGGPLAEPLAACLGQVPGAAAVNNHMGSAFSEAPLALDRLFSVLRRWGLPFLDSRTSGRSQVCAVARKNGVRCLARDVFLDDQRDPATVEYRLFEAARLARRRGWAIAIGHPIAATFEALEKFAARSREVTVVRLTRLFLRR